jgi:hypothetical protein
MSLYVGPYSMCQLIADTPEELEEACHRMKVVIDWPIMLDPKKRPWALGLGAIELSRREFVVKLSEIEEFGRGSGPNLSQIRR